MSPLMLDSADLDRLEAAIKRKKLPDTIGFFFGNSDGSETGMILASLRRRGRPSR